jgi:hypothetical protein
MTILPSEQSSPSLSTSFDVVVVGSQDTILLGSLWESEIDVELMPGSRRHLLMWYVMKVLMVRGDEQ